MLVLSADPGKVTGFSWYREKFGKSPEFYCNELPAMEATLHIEDEISLFKETETYDPRIVLVAEAFTINQYTARQTAQYDALEVIGVMRYFSRAYFTEFHLQKPAQRKVVTDDALKRLKWWKYSPDKHMIDASKHLAVRCLHLGILKPEQIR